MYTIRKLRKMASEKGIKYYTKMNSQTLCEKLGISFEKNFEFELKKKEKLKTPVCIILLHWETGEKIKEFPSIYKAAKYLEVNPGSIINYIKSNNVITNRSCGLIRVAKKN